MPEEPILSYWYRALSTPLGIELNCSDASVISGRLNAARKEAQDPDLACISICVSPFDPDKLWLVKRKVETDNAQA